MHPASGSWISCPQCSRSMPPDAQLCAECQVKADMEEGMALAKAHDYAQALNLFKKVCAVDGQEQERSQAYYYSGAIFLRQNKVDKARVAFEKCLQINAGHAKAKRKLIDIILQKPKKQWTASERDLAEGSDFAKARAGDLGKRSGGSVKSTRWVIALVVFLVVLGVAYFGLTTAIRYFTFGRHVEDIANYASTGQVEQAMQRFNDIFGSPDHAHQREDAQKALAPRFRAFGKEQMSRGDLKKAEKFLKVASGFDPANREIQQEWREVQKKLRQDEPASTESE